MKRIALSRLWQPCGEGLFLPIGACTACVVFFWFLFPFSILAPDIDETRCAGEGKGHRRPKSHAVDLVHGFTDPLCLRPSVYDL